jgi:hypothetical protein
VRVDNYRKRRRIGSRECAVEVLPEHAASKCGEANLPAFEELIASLPENQREVLTMLKVNELSLEEVAHATSSTVGALKQPANLMGRFGRRSLDGTSNTGMAIDLGVNRRDAPPRTSVERPQSAIRNVCGPALSRSSCRISCN